VLFDWCFRWDWADRWTVDGSSRFGTADADGWFYGATFDRLNEALRSSTASGAITKTSIVRKRRWVRTILCTSPELIHRICYRIDVIANMRKNIELSLHDREEKYKSVKFYEENRSFVFAQSLHLATQGTLNTLAVLKELGNKLKLFKMVTAVVCHLQISFLLFFSTFYSHLLSFLIFS
jgi:hypothetical protein